MRTPAKIKRALSLVLVLAMLLPCAEPGLVIQSRAAEEGESKNPITDAALIAEYYVLEPEEEALLNSGLLKSESHSFTPPAENQSGLVEVAQSESTVTVTASDYTNDKGNIWKPVSATLTADGTTKVLARQPDGTFTCTYENSVFSIKVEYVLSITVTEATQNALLAAMADLKKGVAALDEVADASKPSSEDPQRGLSEIEDDQAMELLHTLATGGFTFGSFTIALVGDGKEAAEALCAEYNKNKTAGTAKLDLTIELSNNSRTKSLLQNWEGTDGAHQKLTNTVDRVKDIVAENCWNIVKYGAGAGDATCKTAKGILDDLEAWSESVGTILGTEANWSAAGNTDLVKSGMTDEEYTALDSLVAALPETQTTVSVVESLPAATATVQHNMSMYNVTVVAKWMVAGGTVDSPVLTQKGDTYTKTVTLAKGTEQSKIKDAVAAAEEAAKASWGSEFSDNYYAAPHFDLPETLTEDITRTITYAPVNCSVSKWGEETVNLPYGYRLTLPAHDNAEKAYDYTVNGTAYAQGAVYKITGATNILRTEGKAYTTTDLYTVVADSYGMSDKGTAILTSGALEDNETIRYRLPTEGLVSISGNTLAARTCAASYGDYQWMPYSYTLESGTNETTEYFTSGETTAALSGIYDSVSVVYRLTLTGFESAGLAAAKLPNALAAEAQTQKNALDTLNGRYENMEQVTPLVLTGLSGAADSSTVLSEDQKTTYQAVISSISASMGDNKKLKLYNSLTGYRGANGGLTYYYQHYNDFVTEVNALSSNLNLLMKDEATFKRFLVEALTGTFSADKIQTLSDNLGTLKTTLDKVKAGLTEPNSAIDTTSDRLPTLVEALTREGETRDYTAAQPLTIDSTPFVLAGLGKVVVKVTVSAGSRTETVSKTFNTGDTVSKADISAIKNDVTAAIDTLGIKTKYYTNDYDNGADLDALEGEISENKNFTYTWTPKEYTVKIGGEFHKTITINDRSITLPESGNSAVRYEYTIGTKTGLTGSYTFTEGELDNLFASGACDITRSEINVGAETLDKFIEDIDPDGVLKVKLNHERKAVILEIDAAGDTLSSDLEKFVTKLAEGSAYRYVGLNGAGFVYQDAEGKLKVSLQTLLSAILSDNNFGSAKITRSIDKDGNITESKMIATTIELGSSAESIAETLGFEIHLTGASGQMVTVRNGLERVEDNIAFRFESGKLALDFTLPEKIYEVYLAALLMTGNVELDEVNGLNQDAAYKFLYDLVEVACGENVSATTYVNTIKKLDKDDNSVTAAIEEYQKYIDYVIEYLGLGGERSKLTLVESTTAASGYKLEMTADAEQINKTLGKVVTDANKLSLVTALIKECGEGGQVSMDITASITNVDTATAFQALVFDKNALSGATVGAKAQVVDFTRDIVSRLSSVTGLCGVILLSDIGTSAKPVELTIGSATYLDLNGHTIYGDITVASGAKLTIIDSSIDTLKCGGVTGSISGSCTIVGGKYTADVSTYLKQGYSQNDDGIVTNDLYTVDEAANGDITVQLNANMLRSDSKFTAQMAGTLALDICGDILINYYPTASLSMGEDMGIFEIPAVGLLEIYESEAIADEVIETLVDAIDNDGIKTFLNALVEDFTDFETISASIGSGSFASYDLTTAPWLVKFAHYDEPSGGYLDVLLGANTNSKTVKLTLTVVGDEQYKTELKNMTAGLDTIVTSNIALDTFTTSFENSTVSGEVSGHAKVTIDMTGNSDYAVVVGYIMAYSGTKGVISEALENEFVDALKANDLTALKAAWDKVTVEQALQALEKINDDTTIGETIAPALGLSSYVTEGADSLEKVYHRLLDALGWALGTLKVDELSAAGKTMAELEKNSKTYGEYLADKKNYTKTPSATAGGYTFQCKLGLSEGSFRLKLFTKGVTVSGTAVSWNNTDNAEYYLYPAATEDATIRAQWKTDGTVGGYTYTGTKGSTITDVTVGENAMKSQSFSFGAVAPGEYKLVIFKPGKYVPKIVPVTVGTANVDLGQQKLWLYGDMTYDKDVDGTDAQQIMRYYSGKTSVIGNAAEGDMADILAAANVTFVYGDTDIDGTDAQQIRRFYASKSSVFDTFR